LQDCFEMSEDIPDRPPSVSPEATGAKRRPKKHRKACVQLPWKPTKAK